MTGEEFLKRGRDMRSREIELRLLIAELERRPSSDTSRDLLGELRRAEKAVRSDLAELIAAYRSGDEVNASRNTH